MPILCCRPKLLHAASFSKENPDMLPAQRSSSTICRSEWIVFVLNSQPTQTLDNSDSRNEMNSSLEKLLC
jgi:hypothetical protein